MEKINWFPGHMQKALRMMEAEVKNIDAVIYVLDSRAPFACLNPEFVRIIGEKPILYVLNKIDLADAKKIGQIKQNLPGQNKLVIELNSTASGALKLVSNSLISLCNEKIEKFPGKLKIIVVILSFLY